MVELLRLLGLLRMDWMHLHEVGMSLLGCGMLRFKEFWLGVKLTRGGLGMTNLEWVGKCRGN
jgi:hypothetical protein